MNDLKESIGLLGGTYDPVHNGHLSIARSFLNSDYIDLLWILLTPAPPHKPNQSITPYRHRRKMLDIAFEDMPDIRICDIEKDLPSPSYTIQTLEHLEQQYPSVNFYLCMGEDSLKHFTKWYRWKEILEKYKILVASRPNVEITVDDISKEKIHQVGHEPIAVSSTELREKISNNIDVNELIPDDVLTYIKEHKLYI